MRDAWSDEHLAVSSPGKGRDAQEPTRHTYTYVQRCASCLDRPDTERERLVSRTRRTYEGGVVSWCSEVYDGLADGEVPLHRPGEVEELGRDELEDLVHVDVVRRAREEEGRLHRSCVCSGLSCQQTTSSNSFSTNATQVSIHHRYIRTR